MENPAGLHKNGTGGTAEGLGDYITRLSEADLRPVVCSPDDAGLAVEVGLAGGVAIFRETTWSYAPNYDSGDPAADGRHRWHEVVKPALPPEIVANRDAVWLEILTEPRKEAADYVHAFMLACAQEANRDGYRVAGPSWSTGTPEVDAWESEAGLAFLRYLANNDRAALALHEYSLDPADVETGYPWLVGRYRFILDVCDEVGLAHPRIMITEAGWTYDDMPDPEPAMEQVKWMAAEYGDIPFALWTIGAWGDAPDLPLKLQQIIPEMTDWILANYEPVENPDKPDPPPPPPEPEPRDWRLLVWEHSLEEQEERGINLNPDFGLQKMILERENYTPVTREVTVRGEAGDAYGYMAAEDVSGEGPRIALAFKRPWSGAKDVEVLTEEELPEPEPEPFAWKVWPTDHKVVTQSAGNNPAYYGKLSPHFAGHEGVDIRAPLGEPVYAVNSGVVSDMRRAGDDGHPYGRFVRVLYDDGIHEVTYAHLQKILVEEGEQVRAGQEIALADNTGNIVSGSSHLHITLKRDGVIVDPTPYLLPHNPSFPGLPPAEHGVTVCDVSRWQGNVDFAKMMRRGVHGCYIRSSIGAVGLDDAFERNWQSIKGTHMKRGMYHLFRSNTTARGNLNNIINKVQEYGHGDLRIAVDVEPVGNEQVNGNKVGEFIPLFRDAFGYDPLIYTGLWVLNPGYHTGDKSWMTASVLWLASFWQAPPQVGQYPQLPAGGTLDRLLVHQWSSNYRNGRDFGAESSGLDINVVYDMSTLLVEPSEPAPPPPPPPQGKLIDLTRFKVAHPDAWRVVKHVDGEGHETNEDVQDLQLGDGLFVRRKNRNGEWHQVRGGHFYLVHDTSPAPGSDGVARVYTLYKGGSPGAPKSKIEQRVGETWREEGKHLVQFRAAGDCRKLAENSGEAQNRSVITRYEQNYTFNAYGQQLTVDEVIFEETGAEIQIYARHNGRSLGWVGWQSPWGTAELVEIYWDRGQLTEEPDRVCDWE